MTPFLSPEATPLGEIYQFRVVGEGKDLYELRGALEWDIARILKQVPGVADVVTFGGYLKEYVVEVDPGRLQQYGVTLGDITTALSESNVNVGGGFVTQGDQELTVRAIGAMQSPDDIKQVVLRSARGTPLTVGDVATRVVQGHTQRRGTVGYNLEKESVEGFVLLRRGENPSIVLDALHAKVDELNDHILTGMKIVPFYDRTNLVEHTLDTVHENLLHGFLLILGVLWLFVRSITASLVVATVIPLALLAAFIGLYMVGLPANLISLGAIDFGIIVDGAVILAESVLHRVQTTPPASRRMLIGQVIDAATDVARPTFYAMAIIIAALIPVFTLERVEGRIFGPLAFTYSFALLGALVFSLTVVPAMLAMFLPIKKGEKGAPAVTPGEAATGGHHAAEDHEPRFIRAARNGYRHSLRFLRRRWPVAGLLGGALIATTVFAVSNLGSEFLPELDEGDLVVFVEMPPSISLEHGQDLLLEVRRRILRSPEVLEVLSEQGRPEDGTDNGAINMSETFVHLRPRGEWRPGLTKEGLTDELRANLADFQGVNFNFSQPIKDNIEEAISGVRGKVVLKVYGPDLDAARSTLEKAKEALQPIAGIKDLDLYRDSVVPQMQIALDRRALARAGIGVATAQETVETALAGKVVTEMWEQERPVPVRVRFTATGRGDEKSVRKLEVPAPNGAQMPLEELADIRIASGVAGINREDNSRFLALKFNIEGRDMGTVVAESIAAVEAAVKPPEGHYFKWGGEFENQQRAMARLQVIVPVALIIVLGLLYGALGSARSALIVLLSAPVAASGGAVALLVAGVPLSVSAAIGFIALMGQTSLSGLLVLSAIEVRRRAGEALATALIEGPADRLRAVVIAGILAILGLLPMVLSTGVGSETQRPFALVIVGGMVSTLLVALFLLPVVYAFVTPKVLKTKEEL